MSVDRRLVLGIATLTMKKYDGYVRLEVHGSTGVALGQPEQCYGAEEKGVLAQVDGELNPNRLTTYTYW